MARAGMAELITRVREMTQSGTADYTVNSVSYFTDAQIQTYLDESRQDYFNVELSPLGEINSGGTTVYQRYYLPDQAKWVERAGTGSLFKVYEADGGDPGTANYTVNYDSRNIYFTNDTLGTTYYLDFSAYDLNRVAASVWEMKAGFVSANVDWQSDNHRISASQEAKAYREKAKEFKMLAGPRFSVRRRVDER